MNLPLRKAWGSVEGTERRALDENWNDRCSLYPVGALRVDEAVGAEIARLLQPLGVEATIQAITQCEHQSGEKQRQIESALEQARYEATRARRQYDVLFGVQFWL